MRKRKLYLSEFLRRYNEDKDEIHQIEIFPKNQGQWCFDNINQCFDYLPNEILDKQVTAWQTYNNTIFIDVD